MEKTVIKDRVSLEDWFNSYDVTKVAFDTETTGLNYYYLNIVGCSFATEEAACYIDLTAYEALDTGMVEFLKDMFATRIKRLVMHNAPFDLKVLHKTGITDVTEAIFCTMTAAHLLDENDRCGLKHLAELYLDEITVVSFEEASIDGFHSDKFYEYATNDAEWTWRLHKIFDTEIRSQGMYRLFYEIEMPFQFVLMDLEINGMLVDPDRLLAIEDEMADCIKVFEGELLEMCGLEYKVTPMLFGGPVVTCPINFNSNEQVDKFCKMYGVELELTPKSKKPKIDKFVFEEYKNNEFMYKLWQYRIALDILNKFVKPMKGFICGDGRIRGHFNGIGTRTGRLSSSTPNLQNLRNVKKALPVNCRNAFIVPKGKVMASFDYAGQELRVLAHESQDPKMIKAFNDDMDLHLMTARMIFDLPITDEQLCNAHPDHDRLADEEFKAERHRGKNGVNFPIIYGATAMRISRDNNVSMEVAQEWIDAYFALYKGVKGRLNRCISDVRNKRFVTNLVGRKRRFRYPFKKTPWGEKVDEKCIRQAFNFLIQGFSAEMLRLSMIKIRRLFNEHPEWNAKIISTIHDEVLYEIDEGKIDESIPLVTEIMESCVTLRIPVKVGCGYGKNYSEAK